MYPNYIGLRIECTSRCNIFEVGNGREAAKTGEKNKFYTRKSRVMSGCHLPVLPSRLKVIAYRMPVICMAHFKVVEKVVALLPHDY